MPCKSVYIGKKGFRIIPEYPNKKFSYEISSIELFRMFWNICRWDLQDSYMTREKNFPENQIVVFDMDKAERINDADFSDSESAIVREIHLSSAENKENYRISYDGQLVFS